LQIKPPRCVPTSGAQSAQYQLIFLRLLLLFWLLVLWWLLLLLLLAPLLRLLVCIHVTVDQTCCLI
jgi:hypothetical protein